ncbi:MAG: VTT domain-containing protein [Phycisphaerales bacterium]
MDAFIDALWQLVSEPGLLRENLANVVDTLGGPLTYAMLGLIVFCETGLVVTPFLPGDSLLFATGAVTATVERVAAEQGAAPAVTGPTMALVLLVCAVLGDGVNYHVGRAIGPVAFSGRFRWLRREHLERTQAFFERHGGRAVVIARFVPIVRTFAPFVAGVGTMAYGRFLFYNVFGAVLWVGLLLGGGYWLGGLEFVQRHFSKVVLAIIAVSLLPIAWEWWKLRQESRAGAAGR